MSKPGAVQVLGILHIVFAGIMILFGLSSLMQVLFSQKIAAWQAAAGSGVEGGSVQELSTKVQAEMGSVTMASSLISIGVSVVMLIAGIKLVRSAWNALKWSNWYAWFSIGEKVVMLLIGTLVVAPMVQKAFNEIGGEMTSEIRIFKGAMMGGMIASALIGAIYPVLTLILLNRPSVKAWFVLRGGRPGGLP